MSASAPLRIGVVGGGPAGSLFSLYALKYARESRRDVAVTIYEGKDFRHYGRAGCNMCAGIIPGNVLSRFKELDLKMRPELVLERISTYSLHTSAGVLSATQPDPSAEIISVYRGAGPVYGHPPDLIGFDEMLIEEAVSRGVQVKPRYVQRISRGEKIEVTSDGETGRYDLLVLAAGVNPEVTTLDGFEYRPPITATMCQTELHLGEEEVAKRLGSTVHIFLPPDGIAAYGVLVPKGPFVTVCLIHARQGMLTLKRFLELSDVKSVLGDKFRIVCGCMPRSSLGLAVNYVDDGFVAIGDASATRLYKNGLGSAWLTAERAAWTAINRGTSRRDFAANYMPVCRAIDSDNRVGRLLFLEVPVLKRSPDIAAAHQRLVSGLGQRHAAELHQSILWGMFTGAYTYRQMFSMAVNPILLLQMIQSLAISAIQRRLGLPVRRRLARK